MHSRFRALLIEQIVALRKRILDKRGLHDVQHFVHLLAALQVQTSYEQNPVSGRSIFDSHHQSEIVELTLDASLQPRCLANVKGKDILAKFASEDIHTGLSGKFIGTTAVVDPVLCLRLSISAL
jgi:hypothetical protein